MSLRNACSVAASGDCCCEGAPAITTQKRSGGRILIKLFMVGIVADRRDGYLAHFAHSGREPTSGEQFAIFTRREAGRSFEAFGELALIRKTAIEGDLRDRKSVV